MSDRNGNGGAADWAPAAALRGMIGWDAGGVNTKVARIPGGEGLAVRGRPYEVQRASSELAPLRHELALEVGADAAAVSLADALARAQVARITTPIGRVLAGHPSLRIAVVTSLGAFLGNAAARCAPATSVAVLLEWPLAARAPLTTASNGPE